MVVLCGDLAEQMKQVLAEAGIKSDRALASAWRLARTISAIK